MTTFDPTRSLRVSINPKIIDKNEHGANQAESFVDMAVTADELAEFINEGLAFSCQLSGNRRTAKNFVCSGVLTVDIDGTRSIADTLADPFVRDQLTIFYTTASHTPEQERFRLVFALPAPITNPRDMAAAYRSLALQLGGDRSSTDAARLFYGSRGSNPVVYGRELSEDNLKTLISRGLDADQRVGNEKTPSTTVSRLPIAMDRMVKLRDGGSVSFGEIPYRAAIHCPFHHDQNASAFVTRSKSGTHGIHCSTCAQSFWPPGTSFHDDFSDFDTRVSEAEAYFKRNEDIGPFQPALTEAGDLHHTGLTRCHIFNQAGPFIELPEKLPEGLVFIKSPKGTGKTEALARMQHKNDGSTLLIGHRRALIRQTCERLDLACYLDLKGDLTASRVGVCLDSLERVKCPQGAKARRPFIDTVIIDESEQVLSHFLASTIKDAERNKLFQVFRMILRGAKRVVALDADLGWLSFETLSRLAQPEIGGEMSATVAQKKSTLYVNERTASSTVEVYDSKLHLMGELNVLISEGKRVFVASNSRKTLKKICRGLEASANAPKCLLITSKTTGEDAVKEFIAAPAVEALKYDVILASPTLGTGVDITFPNQETHIDAVVGFFESKVTTHFEFDQQLWRVRHPGAVKVWVSPQTFAFDTARDVVKREIQEKQLYKSVLSHYDLENRPVYHADDPLIDMAALVRSGQLASKNRLKANFIAMKRRHGHEIELVESDDILEAGGSAFDRLATKLEDEEYRAWLLSARTLNRDEFEEMREREEQEGLQYAELACLERSRIERFYRQALSDDLIAIDDRSRLRERIRLFESLRKLAIGPDPDEKLKSLDGLGLQARFLRDDLTAAILLRKLLMAARVYDGSRFDVAAVYSVIELGEFMNLAIKFKPQIENQLDIEVPKKAESAVKLLRSLLRKIGIDQDYVMSSRAKNVAGGTKIRFYRISEGDLKLVEDIIKRREDVPTWSDFDEMTPLPPPVDNSEEPQSLGQAQLGARHLSRVE